MKKISKFIDPANYYNSVRKHSWIGTLFSITLVSTSATIPLTQSQLLREQGISGLWVLAAGSLASGLVIFFFSELWQRSGLKNDNNFVYKRFNPGPAKLLNRFRGYYVGGIVLPVITAMMLVSFAKLTEIYFGISYNSALILCTGVVVLSSILTGYDFKIMRDKWLMGMFSVGWMALTIYSIIMVTSADWLLTERFRELGMNTSLWGRGDLKQVMNVVLYAGVLWWSNSVMDGSGSSAQRFINTKSLSGARRSAMGSRIMFVIISGGFLVMNFAALTHIHDDYEMGFILFLVNELPPQFSYLAYGVLSLALLTSVDGTLNTAASYLYDKDAADKNDESKKRHPVFIMLLLVSVMSLVALLYESVTDILFFLIAMGAGVGPVFVLRWFWMRVNAWSQLSAMLSSFLLVVFFDTVLAQNETFTAWLTGIENTWYISAYAFKVYVITIMVTIIWLTVTWKTAPVSPEIITSYKKQFGLRTKRKATNPFKSPAKWFKAIIFGFIMCTLYFWGWWLLG